MEYNEIYNNNILGIKPIIQLWNGSVGAYNINNFNISDDTAKLRLISYLNNANGNNTTLYSFYNKKVFLDLLKLSLSHPTRGGYTDWAFVAGLVSSGKILVDSSKLLLYKNTNWFGTQEYINEQDRKLYEKAEQRKACQNALTELENCLERLDEDAGQKKLLRYVNDVNSVLRRVALVKFPELNPGSLVGETWIAFIRRTGNSSQLDDQLSAALSHGRFRKQLEVDSQALNQMARSWILSVYQKEATPPRGLELTEGSHQ